MRKEKKITQTELAKHINISTSTISMYEKGNRNPDLKTLKIIADYFNVDTDYLLDRSSTKLKYDFSIYQKNYNDSEILDSSTGEGTNGIDNILMKEAIDESNELFELNMVILKKKGISENEKLFLKSFLKNIFLYHYLKGNKE
ncbi:transcriptional regulator with XRE-family HTH domain [Fusobacterium sp. PH5-44]